MATTQQIKEHIEQYAPIIQELAKKYGYKVCSPIIAQSITETVSSKDKSGWSILKYKYHNFFGMKCGRSWQGASVNLRTGEYYNGKYVNIVDNFRAYKDDLEGLEGYFVFTSTPRYSKLKLADTPEKYLQELQFAGYATSPYYIKNNLNLIKKYNLEIYDNMGASSATVPEQTPAAESKKLPVLRVGMTDKQLAANYIECWKLYLLTCGYNLTINGVFDAEMFSAVINYQKTRGLVCDGIIGAKTWASIPKP